MRFLAPVQKSITDRTETRLLLLAGGFVVFLGLALTFAPAARSHFWQVPLRYNHWAGIGVWLALFFVMQRIAVFRLPDRDPYLIPLTAALSGWGLLTIWRLTPDFGLRQTIWLALSLLLVSIGMYQPALLTWLRKYKYIWLTGGILLLGATFILGTNPEGAAAGPRMWLGCCGGLYLQPSEPLKLLLVIYLAAFLADDAAGLNLSQLIAPSLILTSIALLLLIAQRDLGTASIFVVLYAVTLYISTGRRRVILISAGVMLAAVLAGYFYFGVVRLRLDAWINPWADPAGRSYQIVQSLIAFASGGIAGKGIGLGSPGVVPVAQSDFIFAAIGEETGLAGMIGLLLLIGLLALRGLRTALHAPDAFQRSLAAGLTTFLAAQSILIIGGNLRLLPLTGVTLPFVSYGGSSLVTSFLCLLILLRISSQPDLEPLTLPNRAPYQILGGAIFAGLALCAVLAGWWTIIRGPALAGRTDNPRLAINDRYVTRGAILDRNGVILDQTQGSVGDYTRVYNALPAVPVTGYTSPVFGRTGLEASFDNTLRGLSGSDPAQVFWYSLLYGQPPPGRDIRTSLDITLQTLASQLLEGQKGAAILMNAQTGEIMVMASQPGYDPATLEENWPVLRDDPGGPLVNRAAQGLYPAGTILGPFLLAEATGNNQPGINTSGTELTQPITGCAGNRPESTLPGQAISAGCRSAVEEILHDSAANQPDEWLGRIGFFDRPQITLDAASQAQPATNLNSPAVLLGADGPQVSPLQVVLAAAALSNEGFRPTPRLVMAVNDSRLGWTLVSQDAAAQEIYSASASKSAAQAMAAENQAYWSAQGAAPRSGESGVSWFTAGTLPAWQSTRLALVVLIEGEDAPLAKQIGERLMFAAQGR